LHNIFPSELTMWIDPLEVSYRIGENGSICVLYEYKKSSSEAWKPSTNLNNKHSASTNQNTKNVLTMSPSPLVNRNESIVQMSSETSCRPVMKNMDYLLDPRKSVSIEQLAAYVSS